MEISKSNLRVEFVEMLFALAIAEVAIECSNAIFQKIAFIDHPYVYSHLFLGAFITTLSWIGWQNSKSKGNTMTIESIFSLPFIILLFDILLVIFYFIIVRAADFAVADNKAVFSPDANIETFWSMCIFIIYIIWDFITKGLDIRYVTTDNITFKKVSFINWKAFIKRTWPGIICLVMTGVFYFAFRHYILSGWKIFLVDISLLSIFVLFRGLKPDLKKSTVVFANQIPSTSFIAISPGSVVTAPSATSTITVADNLHGLKVWVSVIIPLFSAIMGFILVLIL